MIQMNNSFNSLNPIQLKWIYMNFLKNAQTTATPLVDALIRKMDE